MAEQAARILLLRMAVAPLRLLAPSSFVSGEESTVP
jgi:hypothetical protein